MILHTVFDLAAAVAATTVTALVYRWRLTDAGQKIEHAGIGYAAALLAGAAAGGFGAGTLNLWLSGAPGIGRSIGLGEYIYLGQGEKLTEGKNKASILADTMEALIGATYVSNDIETARQLVMRLIGPLLKDAAALGAGARPGRRRSSVCRRD